MLTERLSGAWVFLRPGPTDMRKQINGLAVLVEQTLGADPFSHAVFLFCNRERRILKAIYSDRTGCALWMKRLEKHRFPWPVTGEQDGKEITAVTPLRSYKRRTKPFEANWSCCARRSSESGSLSKRMKPLASSWLGSSGTFSSVSPM